jgi:signal transduction histidine kinase
MPNPSPTLFEAAQPTPMPDSSSSTLDPSLNLSSDPSSISAADPLPDLPQPDLLIVDDIPDNIRFLSKFLMAQGYAVRKATSGPMALRAIAALLPDLILLDVNMGEMSGYELCAKLKENPDTQHIPIIFLSAGSDALDKVKAFKVGGSDYITKPFQLEEVLVRVQTQLTLRSLQESQKIQNQKLRQTLEDLKRAQASLIQQEKMSTLKKVVAGVAHEVNNPLTFISGNVEPARQSVQTILALTQLYQQHYPDPPAAIRNFQSEVDLDFVVDDLNNILQSMKTGAARIKAVVSALRNFTHLDEAGLKRISLQDSLETVLTLLHYRLENRSTGTTIQVRKNYHPIPLVTCYAEQISQAVFNLLVNAVDAIEAKLERLEKHPPEVPYIPEIVITLQQESEQRVRLRIQDNGIGLPQEKRDRLFEPFFSTKPAGKGLGLGLVTTRRIIEEQHYGRLSYAFEDDYTTFSISMPISDLAL